MVTEHAAAHGSQWAAMEAMAPKLGCTAETLRRWVGRRNATAASEPV